MRSKRVLKASIGVSLVVAGSVLVQPSAHAVEASYTPSVTVEAYSFSGLPFDSSSGTVADPASWVSGAGAVGVGCRRDGQLDPPPLASFESCAVSYDSAHAGVVIGEGRIRLGTDARRFGSSIAQAHLQDIVSFSGPTPAVDVTFSLHMRGVIRTDPATGVPSDNDQIRPASANLSTSLQIGGIDNEIMEDDLGLNVSYLNGGTLRPGAEPVYDNIHLVAPLFDPMLYGIPYAGEWSHSFQGLLDRTDHPTTGTNAVDLFPGATQPATLVVTLPTGVPLPFAFSASSNAKCYTSVGPCFSEADFAPGVYAVISVPSGYTMTSALGATYAGISDPPMPGAAGTIQLLRDVVAVDEAGTITVQVVRAGGTTGAISARIVSRDITAPSVAGSPATAGEDYDPFEAVVEFADGDATPKSVSIAAKRDDNDEVAEVFMVDLADPTGGAALGTPGALSVTITNVENPTDETGGCAATGASWLTVVPLLTLWLRRSRPRTRPSAR